MARIEFAPISKREDILPIISHIHFVAYDLCMKTFKRYLPNSGNLGLFARTDEEYAFLQSILKEIAEPSNNPNQKYFKLIHPIVIPQTEDIPETAYTYIYFRKPDPTPYGQFLGDIDFIL